MFSSLRKKSRPANIRQPDSNASFPASEASPVSTGAPEPVLTPHMHPRPRSSWYSQPSVAYASPHEYTNPYAPPTVPMQYQSRQPIPLTSTALRSLDDTVRPASGDWEDEEAPESPRGTQTTTTSGSSRHMSPAKRTAVSEYLSDRAWESRTPAQEGYVPLMPDSAPPPVPSYGGSALRRLSSFASDRPLSRRESRRGSARSRSSITTLPYRLDIQQREDHQSLLSHQEPDQRIPRTPLRPIQKPQTPSLTFSTPFSFTRSKTKNAAIASPMTPSPDTNANTDALISTPYSKTKRGRSPVPVTTLHAFDSQTAKQGPANAALIRGLSQRYRPSQTTHSTPYPPSSHDTGTLPARTDTLSTQTAPPSYHSRAQDLLRPSQKGARVLNTRTRDPAECSDEGSWLYIGTLRGPTPAGVRMIDAAMAKSLEKSGTNEKGVKEIRKYLKHESRATIEWTEVYLRRRWGVEL